MDLLIGLCRSLLVAKVLRLPGLNCCLRSTPGLVDCSLLICIQYSVQNALILAGCRSNIRAREPGDGHAGFATRPRVTGHT